MAWDKEKAKAWRKAYYQANKEKSKAYNKAWHEANRERRAAYDKTRREKRVVSTAVWYRNNRDRILAQKAEYRKANVEKIAARKKAYYQANHKSIREKSKTYRESNCELIRARSRSYYKTNCEKERERHRDYCKNNPEIIAEIGRRKRAVKKNSMVLLTENEKAELMFLENTRKTLQRETGREYHIDHILPLTHGGIHHPVNLRILEGKENLSKNAKLLPEAIDLAYEHYMLYYERISPERAEEFVKQLAKAIGLNEDEIDLKRGVLPSLLQRATLEDYME